MVRKSSWFAWVLQRCLLNFEKAPLSSSWPILEFQTNSPCSLQMMQCNMFGSHSFFFFLPSSWLLEWRRHSKAPQPPYLSCWEFGSLLTFFFCSCWPVIFLALWFPNRSSSPVRSCLARVTIARACCCYLISTKQVNSHFSSLHKSSVVVVVALTLHTAARHSVTVCYNWRSLCSLPRHSFISHCSTHNIEFDWNSGFSGFIFNVSPFWWDIALPVALRPYNPYFLTTPIWHVCATWLTSNITALIT